MPSIISIARRIKREGLPLILRRPGAPDLEFMGFVVGYQPQDIGGDVYQGDRKITLSNKEIENASWPGPPRRGDKVIIKRDNNHLVNIENCETMSLRGDIAMHILQVRG